MDGLFGCLGAMLAAVFVGLTIVLPISTFLRIQRVNKSLEQLRVRVAELEDTVATVRRAGIAAAPASVPSPIPVPPAAMSVPTAETSVRTEHGETFEVATAPPAVPAVPARAHDTLETQIGGKWLLYIGMAALVLGVGFFVKYAFDNEWINETTRVVVGALFGAAMVAAGHRFARRGYELYGHVVAGGGFVALYVSVWAALNLYALIPGPVAFALMAMITASAALMADGLRSSALALVAVLGGFVTPALVGGREDAQVVLLTYVAVLVAGTMFLASRRGWAWLNLLSGILTVLTFAGWAAAHYSAATYSTTQIFITLFGSMFGFACWQEWRKAEPPDKRAVLVILGAVVALFHGASALNLFDHSLALLPYLTLFTLACVAASVRWDRSWLRLAVFLVTVPVFLAWLDRHNTPGWRIAIIVTAMAFYAMHLAAQGERASRNPATWDRADLVLFHAGALALFAALYRVVDVGWPYSTPLLALGLAAWQGLLAWRLRTVSGEGSVNALAATFAMIGFAVGLRFDDWWELVGWAVEAGAIYWAGLQTQRTWMRWGGAVLLLAVITALLDRNFFGTPAGFDAIWNPRAGATLVIVAVIYAMSFFLRRSLGPEPSRASQEYAVLLCGANILTMMLISAEINSYWHLRSAYDATATFSLLASLSIAWGVYGTGLVIVGIRRRYAPLRYLAITLLLLTVAKVFMVDLSELGGVYRIVGFMGLGVCLMLGAWLYQRFRDTILRTGD